MKSHDDQILTLDRKENVDRVEIRGLFGSRRYLFILVGVVPRMCLLDASRFTFG